jgi:hypothetical protein
VVQSGTDIQDPPPQAHDTITATIAGPSTETGMVMVPVDQWNSAVHLLATMAEKITKMYDAMEKLPSVITQREALDEVVSAITQNNTLNSELVNVHTDRVAVETKKSIADKVDRANEWITDRSISLPRWLRLCH